MTRALSWLIAAAFLWVAGPTPAIAQSPPCFPLTFQAVPTVQQWACSFQSKQDYLGSPPLATSGGTMTGPLTTAPSTAPTSGFNLAPGVAPTSPQNGDVWDTATAWFYQMNGATYQATLTKNLAASPTAPIIASGFCTSPSIPVNNGTASFTINVGTGCAANNGTLTMPSAANGWACHFNDLTTSANQPVQTTSGPTQVVITNFARNTGAAQNFTSNDVINAQCTGY